MEGLGPMCTVLKRLNVDLSGWSLSALICIYWSHMFVSGARGSLVVKALSYKPEGSKFDNLWGDF
jgi:hypothetical protein